MRAWDSACCGLMLQLRDDGMTFKDITAHLVALGVEVTRNAVIGKLWRLEHPDEAHLRRRPRIAVSASLPCAFKGMFQVMSSPDPVEALPVPPVRRRKPRLRPAKKKPIIIQTDAARAVAELRRDQCRYIHGDPKAGLMAYCISSVRDHGSYCPQHRRKVYTHWVRTSGVGVGRWR